MSLYHEAAEVLKTASNGGGSLKSIAFGKKRWKSDQKTLFALTTEACKWSEILSEIIENGNVLGKEKQVRILCRSRRHEHFH
jgi:25S rRNA (cytosine2278-C5)-methyltransferase